MENRVKLKVLGITYNQIQNGAYALVLAEVDGLRRIPIVIGAPEAQAIAIRLEHITPPRPLTHDLFASFAHGFGIRLKEVFIYRFENGVFYSELCFSDGEREIRLDSRTSDAIALAMRTKAAIYTTQELIKETGFIIDADTENEIDSNDSINDDDEPIEEIKTGNLNIAELEKLLNKYIATEEYEKAAEIKNIIKNRKPF